MTVDMDKLNALMGKLVGDLGSAMSGALVVIGEKLGLYRALAEGPQSSASLAAATQTNERYVREWLNAQAASGFITYDAASQRFSLTAEQSFALAQPESPASFTGAFEVAQALWVGIERTTENFKSGAGTPWGEQHKCLFTGTERFFRAGYLANLIGNWIPALDGVKEKLERGARVADVGCGLGASTILMAQAFPKSQFFGFDYHPESIALAKKRAQDAGVGDRITFAVAKATDFPGDGYDFIAHFDCLHDLEDPVGAAKHARRTLAKDGRWMVVEPMAADKPEQNHNPVGRVFYSASTCLCVAHSLSQKGPALGAQAGEGRLREVIVQGGGFSSLRRATETPFNMVLEAKA
jgi:SAM-dependent methyltransferase